MAEGSQISIYPLCPSHLSEIADLETLCFAEPWSENSLSLFLAADNFALAAFDGETPVAYCGVVTVLDEGQITNLAVHPDHRRRGIGRALLLSVMREARKRGLSTLSLEVRASNEAALALYAACGWRRAGERKNFYRFPTESAVVMLCDLLEP